MRVKLTRSGLAVASPPPFTNRTNTFIVRGLVVGYIYSIALSASSIAVCEVKGKNCEGVWSQGFTVATGMVTTFLAYLVAPDAATPGRKNNSLPRKPELEDPGNAS